MIDNQIIDNQIIDNQNISDIVKHDDKDEIDSSNEQYYGMILSWIGCFFNTFH